MSTPATPAWAFQIPNSLDADLQELQSTVQRFRSAEVSEAQFRAFRVPMGIYEQQESGTYMLRVRIPAGGVLPEQMRRLAEVAESFGDGTLHVTTRQDIQVHRVSLEAIRPALVSLRQAGLATKGGGGNTVRNITACQDSGVCPDEVFDVAPFAVALTERLMSDRVSFQLPRKYKIAFSGCGADCAGATVNDLGFIARQKDGLSGFAVYVGGGMGGKSRVASLLHEFVPSSNAFLVAEAAKRVFDKHGNRRNKHLARLRFLVERVGLQGFRELYEKELAGLQASAPAPLQVRPYPSRTAARSSGGLAPQPAASATYPRWRRSNVLPQKLPGFFLVSLPLPLGDLAAKTMTALAEVVADHGDGMLWATQAQNLALRWVSEDELPGLHEKLGALGLADPQPPILRNLVACAGASTCRLGLCLSRGLAKALAHSLRNGNLDLEKAGDLRIHISGCPNSCGRHPMADIGLHGAARRVEGQLVPHYGVQVGGRLAEGETRFGFTLGTIPAKKVPAFVEDLLAAFLRSPDAPVFHRFIENGGRSVAEGIAARYRHIAAFGTDKGYCVDWDADKPFSLAGRGPGECSAGVFDLIEVDLASAQEALVAGHLYAATALAARSLLVTCGEQPKSDSEALVLFRKHFAAQGLIEPKLEPLITEAMRCAGNGRSGFKGAPPDVSLLVESVRLLYEGMDSSLRFKPVSGARQAAAPAESTPAATHDFRGIVCPLNYVRTKMALGRLQKGQALMVLLDDPGAKNVPDSARKDGHAVESVTRSGDHWEVLIRKG